MQEMIAVENIKCRGCAKTIESSLLKTPQVRTVSVDIEQGLVMIEGDNLQREQIAQTLLSLGYPEKGSVAGLKSLKAKGKSFVSCAIGRMDKN
ncbi:heavy metal transport/detoxification protein [Thioploca ingrica]|jgi:copper chaperone|uniref:Heavy metal transport/detoxification protein n=1 Tax=Thioploca ingrica TaxID=40754 RepID=A0A090ADE0_9GAMM|nr:heavy metal transport/detoxification protein [Thioploca ingrica]